MDAGLRQRARGGQRRARRPSIRRASTLVSVLSIVGVQTKGWVFCLPRAGPSRQPVLHGSASASGSPTLRGRRPRGRPVVTTSRVERRAIFTEFVAEVAADPRIFLGEVASLVVLSSLFDRLERWARQQIAKSEEVTGGYILDALFKEITGLGFIGLLLFLATRSGLGALLSELLLGSPTERSGENLLAETFEDVHIMIFMLMVVLLFQGAAAFFVTRQVSNCWGEYAQTRAYGTSEFTLESIFVQAGYLERVPNPDAPRCVDLAFVRPFTYGSTFLDRLLLRQDPLHKLVMWRSIRHEFLFPSEVFTRGQDAVMQLPERGLFSFETYLRGRLGKTVLALVEVDIATWFSALLLLVPIVYACRSLPLAAVTAVLCGLAWLLAAVALLLTVLLEEDTYELTPQVPADLRQALRLFAGTSSPMLRRIAQLAPGTARDAYTGSQTADELASRSLMGRRFRPGLGDAELSARPRMGRPKEFEVRRKDTLSSSFPSTRSYRQMLQLLTFFQAVCVTSLIVLYLSEPLDSWAGTVLYFLAWAEWPIFLFGITPVLLRRLTLRSSIEDEKDEELVRKVSLVSKEMLLRDFVRLVQIAGLERRARQKGEVWAQDVGEAWTRSRAAEAFQTGLARYEDLPERDKSEVWSMFSVLDANNDGTVEISEFSDTMKVTGCSSSPTRSTRNLLRLVDRDGDGVITWDKFKAVCMLATNTHPHEAQEDLQVFFDVIDEDKDGQVTVFELSNGLQQMRIGMSSDDAANLLYTYFGRAMPTVTKAAFVDWIQGAGLLQGR